MKLRQIFEKVNLILSSSDPDRRYEAKEEINAFLASIGAEYLSCGVTSYAYKLAFPWGTVVLKYTFKVMGDYPAYSDLRKQYPIIASRYVKPLFRSENVCVQPLCEIRDGEAHKTISRWLEKWFQKLYGWHFDLHAGNVAWYKGRAVVFDVMTPEISRARW